MGTRVPGTGRPSMVLGRLGFGPVSLPKAVLAATDPFLLVLPASQIPVEWDFGVPGAPKCCCQLGVFAGHFAGLLHLRQAQTLQQEAADPPCYPNSWVL